MSCPNELFYSECQNPGRYPKSYKKCMHSRDITQLPQHNSAAHKMRRWNTLENGSIRTMTSSILYPSIASFALAQSKRTFYQFNAIFPHSFDTPYTSHDCADNL